MTDSSFQRAVLILPADLFDSPLPPLYLQSLWEAPSDQIHGRCGECEGTSCPSLLFRISCRCTVEPTTRLLKESQCMEILFTFYDEKGERERGKRSIQLFLIPVLCGHFFKSKMWPLCRTLMIGQVFGCGLWMCRLGSDTLFMIK